MILTKQLFWKKKKLKKKMTTSRTFLRASFANMSSCFKNTASSSSSAASAAAATTFFVLCRYSALEYLVQNSFSVICIRKMEQKVGKQINYITSLEKLRKKENNLHKHRGLVINIYVSDLPFWGQISSMLDVQLVSQQISAVKEVFEK